MFERERKERQRIVDAGVKNRERLRERTGKTFVKVRNCSFRRFQRRLGENRLQRCGELDLPALRHVRQYIAIKNALSLVANVRLA